MMDVVRVSASQADHGNESSQVDELETEEDRLARAQEAASKTGKKQRKKRTKKATRTSISITNDLNGRMKDPDIPVPDYSHLNDPSYIGIHQSSTSVLQGPVSTSLPSSQLNHHGRQKRLDEAIIGSLVSASLYQDSSQLPSPLPSLSTALNHPLPPPPRVVASHRTEGPNRGASSTSTGTSLPSNTITTSASHCQPTINRAEVPDFDSTPPFIAAGIRASQRHYSHSNQLPSATDKMNNANGHIHASSSSLSHQNPLPPSKTSMQKTRASSDSDSSSSSDEEEEVAQHLTSQHGKSDSASQRQFGQSSSQQKRSNAIREGFMTDHPSSAHLPYKTLRRFSSINDMEEDDSQRQDDDEVSRIVGEKDILQHVREAIATQAMLDDTGPIPNPSSSPASTSNQNQEDSRNPSRPDNGLPPPLTESQTASQLAHLGGRALLREGITVHRAARDGQRSSSSSSSSSVVEQRPVVQINVIKPTQLAQSGSSTQQQSSQQATLRPVTDTSPNHSLNGRLAPYQSPSSRTIGRSPKRTKRKPGPSRSPQDERRSRQRYSEEDLEATQSDSSTGNDGIPNRTDDHDQSRNTSSEISNEITRVEIGQVASSDPGEDDSGWTLHDDDEEHPEHAQDLAENPGAKKSVLRMYAGRSSKPIHTQMKTGSQPTARRQGKKVIPGNGTKAPTLIRSSSMMDLNDDTDSEIELNMPTPLGSKTQPPPPTNGKLAGTMALSKKISEDAPHVEKQAVPRTKATRQAEGVALKSASSAPSSKATAGKNASAVANPRRSGRSAVVKSGFPPLKVGDRIPKKDFMQLFERARHQIENAGHVANITVSACNLDEDNEFVETQALTGDFDDDLNYQRKAVRVWHVFIWCRNRRTTGKLLTGKAFSPKKGSSTSRAGTSRGGDNASPVRRQAAPSTSTAENIDATFGRPVVLPTDGTYRHSKDANCPAQISAYLEPDPHNQKKAFWRIEQASDHCLQCSELDMEIGKGSENLVEAREEYFEYWSKHWDYQLKGAIEATNSFNMKPPTPTDDSGAPLSDIFASQSQHAASRRNRRQQDNEESDDENRHDGNLNGQAALPNRKNKRKIGPDENDDMDIHRGDPDEFDAPSPPYSRGTSSASSATKRARFADDIPEHHSPIQTQARNVYGQFISSATGGTRPAKSKPSAKKKSSSRRKASATRKKSMSVSTSKNDTPLSPTRLVTDFELPEIVEQILDEAGIATLDDLRRALEIKDAFFGTPMQVELEDMLAFWQKQLRKQGKRVIGFQYGLRRNIRGGAGRDEEEEEQNEDEEDGEDREHREKVQFGENCSAIMQAAAVLERALDSMRR